MVEWLPSPFQKSCFHFSLGNPCKCPPQSPPLHPRTWEHAHQHLQVCWGCFSFSLTCKIDCPQSQPIRETLAWTLLVSTCISPFAAGDLRAGSASGPPVKEAGGYSCITGEPLVLVMSGWYNIKMVLDSSYDMQHRKKKKTKNGWVNAVLSAVCILPKLVFLVVLSEAKRKEKISVKSFTWLHFVTIGASNFKTLIGLLCLLPLNWTDGLNGDPLGCSENH